MQVKVAAVQPRASLGNEEESNVQVAIDYLDAAAQEGAQFVCFPEGYPGPSSTPLRYSADTRLSERARRHGIYVIAGSLEAAARNGQFYVTSKLFGPDGQVVGAYRRTTPQGPYIYAEPPAANVWGFEYVTGSDLPVFETPFGTVGLLICSEIYVPELARILTLKGAEIIFAPAGAMINELMPTWKTMVWARAIENLLYTVTCQNLFKSEEGVAMVAAPEEILAERSDPGMIFASLDMDRIRWLREQEERIEIPKPYRTIPGTLRWCRADLYREALDGELVAPLSGVNR